MNTNTWFIVVLVVLAVCYWRRPVVGQQRQPAAYGGRQPQHRQQPLSFMSSEYSPDPLNNITDMAKDGISMNEIQNTQVKYVV